MKQGVIGSPWSDKHKVLAVAIAPKEPLWEWPGIHPLNTFSSVVNVMQGFAQQLGQPEKSEQSEQVCTIM